MGKNKQEVTVTAFCFVCKQVVFANLITLGGNPSVICMECHSDDTEVISDRLGEEIENIMDNSAESKDAKKYIQILLSLGYELLEVNGVMAVQHKQSGMMTLFTPVNVSIPPGVL